MLHVNLKSHSPPVRRVRPVTSSVFLKDIPLPSRHNEASSCLEKVQSNHHSPTLALHNFPAFLWPNVFVSSLTLQQLDCDNTDQKRNGFRMRRSFHSKHMWKIEKNTEMCFHGLLCCYEYVYSNVLWSRCVLFFLLLPSTHKLGRTIKK